MGTFTFTCARRECSRVVEGVDSSWEYGSYCSLECVECPGFDKQGASSCLADMDTTDGFLGINAFRRQLPQLGADDGKETLQQMA